jgi:hypothetical protein
MGSLRLVTPSRVYTLGLAGGADFRVSVYCAEIDVFDFTGAEPGSCDIVRVVERTSSPALTLVRVCDRLKVPPS